MGEQDETRLSAMQAYQANVRKSEALQREILLGSKAGEPLASLLLKAAEAISLMTGSDEFRREVEDSLRSLYGIALGDSGALELELNATRERLARIEAAFEQSTDEEMRHELDLAIRAHRKQIDTLTARLG